MSRGGWARPVATAAACAFGVALLGGLMTDIGPWYLNLKQPPWKPPDWLFGPVWTVLYAMTAMAGVLGWRAAPRPETRQWLLVLLAANGFLNVLWSLLFFRLQRPDWALLEVWWLGLSVLLLIVFLARHERRAAGLLLPYLAWVAFAGVLNAAVVRLNGPFA